MWDLEATLKLLLCGQCIIVVALFILIIIIPFRTPNGKD